MIKSNLLHNQESVWEGELYREDGVFKERSDKFVQAQKDQQKLRPNRFDAFYECIKYFPLYGIEASVRAVGARQGLPIHVLWGDHDTMVPYEDGIAKWRRQLEGSACKATFYVQKDAGHSLLIEYPEETSAALYAYMENVS
jgi:pimeloyl-ACP methyl ester carboxylesterase